MAQKVIQGDQLDLTDANGSVLTGVDADLLEGSNKAFYRDAGNLNAGTILSARLSGTYNISISGNAATATSATSATTATTASNSNALGGVAAASWALLASPAFTGNPTAPTQTVGNNTTRLATTAFVTTAVSSAGFTEFGPWAYTGANQLINVAHSFGVVPKSILVRFQNVSVADNGYSPGDATFISAYGSHYSDSGGNCCGNVEGLFPYYSNASKTTTLSMKIGNLGVHLAHKTSGVVVNPTVGRWNIYVHLAS